MLTADEAVEKGAAVAAGRAADPCIMVIFGASGDLTKRKLIPALYNLAKDNLLSKEFALIGVARADLSSEQFRDVISKEIGDYATTKVDPDLWHWFSRRIYYCSGNFDDPNTYVKLSKLLSEVDKEHGTHGNYLYYLSTSPNFFATVVKQLGTANLVSEEHGWRRIIIEKPFGRDYESARTLNKDIRKVVDEKQIYRIDHYLGKETVQNILVFRFANGIFEPVWNRNYVDHVQITAAEDIGIEGRGPFYEKAGALRDVVQNHVMELLSFVALEPPVSFEAEAMRREKVKVWRSISPIHVMDVVRGQYGPGMTDGKPVKGYRQEDRVDPNSSTETYAALKLGIENWRWAGVPFYLRAGKRLAKRSTEITIQFKQPPQLLFKNHSGSCKELQPNLITMRIQPDEGISLRFGAKVPSPNMEVCPVNMNFSYADAFGKSSANGYERLLLDAMLGDATLFAHRDGVEATWSLLTPILDQWAGSKPKGLPNYAAGTWGPESGDELLARDGRAWHKL